VSEPLLVIDHVSKRFGGLVAVNDVSIAIARGEVVGIIGPNGAGKTTLFGCVVGLLRPSSGTITFAGARIDGLTQHAVVRRGICHSHQIPAPFPLLDVRDNIRVARVVRPPSRRGEACRRRGAGPDRARAARDDSRAQPIGRQPEAPRAGPRARDRT